MAQPPLNVTKHYVWDPERVDRVNVRRVKQPLVIQEPDPNWPQDFEHIKSLIEKALGPTALVISHVGSTSIPSLPAKPVIDIDLTVPDILDEQSYAPALEAAGFLFLLREPRFDEHRLFALDSPHCNLHLFAKGAAEPARHLLFRDWLLANQGDRELYAQTKREAAKVTVEKGEDVMAYNARKEGVIRQILERMFAAKGIPLENND
ncbi:grpb/dephospho-CoA kinase [Plectosphaerella plurivora]|uniref:Grpb/dephospho-CoA kinase n=1 Tax=Plectosphaerella plurivora TaxID=936078 RepID=A0A9P8VHK4_9PEZI|nr:grpb/dephospho-CoA kinase [Plectosphaerella plurivora]